MSSDRMTPRELALGIEERLHNPLGLRTWIDRALSLLGGPQVTSFDPPAGQPGCMVTIHGWYFAPGREDNQVEVGGQPATVIYASPTELRVLTARDISDGPVMVTVGPDTAAGPHDFKVWGYPSASAGEDGPPIAFAGSGVPAAGDVNPIGTVRVLVVLLRPNDLAPADPAATRAAVNDVWDNVVTYYDQASYTRTQVQIDMTADWAMLDGTTNDFLDGDNIDRGQLDRITAQAAQAATDEGFNLDNYAMMACVVFLNNTFIRAWGGWSRQNFTYNNGLPPDDPNRIDINITADHSVNLLAINETADWGRCAHEFGHNVVSAPSFMGDGTATLGEDIYSSDLVDPNAASAQLFDLMGSHDTHPLFSGFHLDKLTYYQPANIRQLAWDRNPFSNEFDIVAHGLVENNAQDRVHLIKIKVSDGLFYYVQVRQRPGTTAQIFDDSIPFNGAASQGGVIVTRVISDTLHINQQTRFLTLLHAPRVLRQGDSIEDPARTIRISVVNDNIQARPLVCRVRVEWAQTIADDPNGSFDLTVEPWGSDWTTPDLWVDRPVFGTFDNPNDAEGRPTGNGDRPRVGQVNRIIARIHTSGAMGASNVRATFYSVFPPGVGDNGNWAPLDVKQIGNIAANSFADVACNWVPVVGQHTCLKIFAGQQLGEISGGNNAAQENVGDFEAPAGSVPTPVYLRTAIRNPLDERSMVMLGVKGVPQGWSVYFPHAWVWLDAKAERHFDLVVIPRHDFAYYDDLKQLMNANITIDGIVPRQYDEPLAPTGEPAGSRFYHIGGILNRVHIRKRTDISLEEDRERSGESDIAVQGTITPAQDHQNIRVELTDPKGRLRVTEVYTDGQGYFTAQFDLAFEPSLEADRSTWRPASDVIPGIYRVQAFIFGADHAAYAESNLLFVSR